MIGQLVIKYSPGGSSPTLVILADCLTFAGTCQYIKINECFSNVNRLHHFFTRYYKVRLCSQWHEMVLSDKSVWLSDLGRMFQRTGASGVNISPSSRQIG